MADVAGYSIKLMFGLALVWIFYQAVLRPLTFYHWNRFFLLGASLGCFLLPLVNIGALMTDRDASSALVHAIPPVTTYIMLADTGEAAPATILYKLLAVFLIGVVVRIVQLALQWRSLQKVKQSAVCARVDGATLYDVDGDISPFSFSNAVFINSRLHTREELEKIIQHEFVHVKQKHTADLLFSEFLCLVCWFNPFAWLIRRAVRQNLEFIADQSVLASGFDARQYQYLLLKVVGVPQYSLSNHFNFSSLKKRIAMINKNRSSRMNLGKFLLILPLLVMVLLAFRQVDPKANAAPAAAADPAILSAPAAAPDAERSVAKVSSSHVARSHSVRKSAQVNRTISNRADTFPEIAPPPPPPTPAPVPAISVNTNTNKNENTNVEPVLPETEAVPPTTPLKPAAVQAPNLPAGVTGIHQENNTITVFLKNGKKEVFDLNKPAGKAAFKKKYGAMPSPPQPPLKPVKALTTKDPFILSLIGEKKDKC